MGHAGAQSCGSQAGVHACSSLVVSRRHARQGQWSKQRFLYIAYFLSFACPQRAADEQSMRMHLLATLGCLTTEEACGRL